MKNKIPVGLFIICVLLLSQYKLLLSAYARFFTIDNPTIGADAAIVVLSGGGHTRIPKALELYSAGYGARILLTTLQPWNSKVVGIFPTQEQNAARIAALLNVSVGFESVPSLKGGATSTFDEAHDLLAFCVKEKLKHLILVTDSFHTRRALYAFKKVFKDKDSDIKIEVAASQNEIFNEDNWWRSDRGISAYILEPLKFIVYFFGSQNVSFIQND